MQVRTRERPAGRRSVSVGRGASWVAGLPLPLVGTEAGVWVKSTAAEV